MEQAPLHDARTFANHSGEVELQLRCFHSATELHRHLNNLPQSITEAESGTLLADTCGFGQFSIDLRIALAETYLAAGDPHKALQNARNALDRSEAPRLPIRLVKSRRPPLEIRERLGHGRIEETRRALALLPPE